MPTIPIRPTRAVHALIRICRRVGRQTPHDRHWRAHPAVATDGEPTGFARLAGIASKIAGSPLAFVAALTVVALWGVTGPLFHFSDTWQLVINTGTTIATFLLGFLIQYMQNRTGEKTDRVLEHLDKLVSVDHAEHGRLLREIHSHVYCEGHTVIESEKQESADVSVTD